MFASNVLIVGTSAGDSRSVHFNGISERRVLLVSYQGVNGNNVPGIRLYYSYVSDVSDDLDGIFAC
jgi:hypothetical protein